MNVIDLVAIIPFYLSLLLEGLEDFEIIGMPTSLLLQQSLIYNTVYTYMGRFIKLFISLAMCTVSKTILNLRTAGVDATVYYMSGFP